MGNLSRIQSLISVSAREELKRSFSELGRKDVRTVIHFGKQLLEIQERMQRGDFTRWLHNEFSLSSVMAYHFIHVAERFPDPDNAAALNLPITVFYMICSPRTNKKVFIEVVNRAQMKQRVTVEDVKILKEKYEN